jgi:hypothetical protein
VALIALVSAKGSPGVSTTALAITLSWSGRMILAECDPAGGDVLAGYLSGLDIPTDRGLLPLAVAELRDRLNEDFWAQLLDLDAPKLQRLVLPGISDPQQAGTLRPTWPRLAAYFAELEHMQPGFDVIADCGRLTTSVPPMPLLHRADLVLMVLRRESLRTVSPLVPALVHLRRELTEHGAGDSALGLVIVGDGKYKRGEVERRLGLPVLAELPWDERTAVVLSNGGRLTGSKELLRAAASTEQRMRQAIANRRRTLAPAGVEAGYAR